MISVLCEWSRKRRWTLSAFCLLCANASRPRYYVSATADRIASCRVCEDDFALPFVLGVLALVGVPLLVYLARCVLRRWVPVSWRAEAKRRWAVYRLGTKCKLIFSFFQIACKVGVVYQVTLPAEVTALLSFFELAISFGLDLTAPFECLGANSYLQRLQVWIFAPLALCFLLCVIGLLYNLCKHRHRPLSLRDRLRAAVTWALPLIVKLMFLLYSTINLRAFEAFRCHDFGEIDGKLLMADVRVECGSAEHDRIVAWAQFAILLYPVGWTATTALLLFAARRSIVGEQRPTALSRSLNFVFSEYENRFFWWEVVEMFRRVLLVGLMSIVLEGSIVQLVIATLFCIFYLILQLQAKPFEHADDDYVALSSSSSLAVLFFSCVVLKVGTSTPLPDPSHALSP